MPFSLSRKLLFRLVTAQALAFVASMLIFPLVTPYVAYSDIADDTFRRLVIASLPATAGEKPDIRKDLAVETYLAERPSFRFAVVRKESGEVFAGSDPSLTHVVETLGPYLPFPNGTLATTNPSGGSLLVQVLPHEGGDLVFVTSGNSFHVDDVPSFFYVFLPAILPMFAPMILGAVLAVPFVVRRSLAPLKKVTKEANNIDLSSLDQRLPETDLPLEMLPLVQAINLALARLDEGVRRQRLYSANAAHEMRTPIAILQARIETLPNTDKRTQLLTDVHRLHGLVEQLLMVARLQERQDEVDDVFRLSDAIAQILADRAPLAIRSGRELAFNPDRTDLLVTGDRRIVASAISNLVDNALNVEPEGGRIDVGLSFDEVTYLATVVVADHGPGIDPADRQLVFEPFWRKGTSSQGSGLGLSIVREVAQRQNGTVVVAETPGGGATFRLAMPARPLQDGASSSRRLTADHVFPD